MSRTATADGFGRTARALRGAIFAISAFFAASCVTATPARDKGPASAPRTVESAVRPLVAVLLAVDGLRWQEVFHGVDPGLGGARPRGRAERPRAPALMPNLHALVEDGGVLVGEPDSGTSVFASGPDFVSLPGYAEMLTGRSVTGCRDNACGAATAPTFVDELASSPRMRTTEVAVVTSWPDIGRIAAKRPDRIAMSTGRSGGPTRELFRGDPVTRALVDEAARRAPEPGAGDFRPDRHTATIALRYLETARPRFLFVALGEPDEYAHRGDYAGYVRAIRHADLVVGAISRALDERARLGSRTVLIVTADHGRASDFKNHGRAHPESARVFLFAWGTEVSAKRLDAGRERRLADIAPTLRLLFGLPADLDPVAGRPIFELFARSAE